MPAVDCNVENHSRTGVKTRSLVIVKEARQKASFVVIVDPSWLPGLGELLSDPHSLLEPS